MFEIDNDKTIHLTRGDTATVEFRPINKTTNEPHVLQNGDVVRFTVYSKKNCTDIALKKDVFVTGETTAVDILLTSQDTKIGAPISKKKEYWYEIEINPDTAPVTAVGYFKDGEKKMILYPEGDDAYVD